MTASEVQFLIAENAEGDQRRLAYISSFSMSSKSPGLVWLNGFNSVMTSTKVSALAAWARDGHVPLLRFDYSGHGQSEGNFTDGTISQWLNDTLSVLRNLAAGPQILVGSSMGAWLVLLVLRAIASKEPAAKDLPPIVGAVLIAPAWDMTEELMWKNFPDDVRKTIETKGVFQRPSRYEDGAYPITRVLIEDGRKHLIGDTPFDPGCAIRILQGLRDPDVPWQHANRLLRILKGSDIQTFFVTEGDHRLSRPRDIGKLLQIVEDLHDKHCAVDA